MEIFDAHVHVYYSTPLDAILVPMDTLGITHSALLGVDHGFDGDQRGTNVSNQFVSEFVRRAPDRLVGFGSVHADREALVVPIVEEIMTRFGLKGIKIYPHSGFYPNDPTMMAAYHRLEELSGVLIMHTGIKALPHQRMIFNRPLPVDEIAVACPHLPIVICHAGYPWVDEALFIARLNENVWIDLTFLDTLEVISGEPVFWQVLRKVKTLIGCSKVIWGSEGVDLDLEMYPDAGLDRMRTSIRKILDAPFLSDEDKEAILDKNPRRLLAL